MRKISITRRKSPMGDFVTVRILSNNMFLGEIKAEENEKEFEVGNSEQAIQAEIISPEGRHFRSNAFFAIYGGKDIKVFLTMSGTKMNLSSK